ncbi:uncharacterized protein LY89DRAFT_642482 [Mollisia scopiformis]|uniref:Purine-cytosine permease n=1 Tax=Mollisia scopiformis TaxID=149040 RepID=A0A194XI42_MOLSC|nr:uncharacterized protein LY89DRAFT_642482 [Mollisia scopiformis]KUJ19432.1 hypothetical protein LY89DRAFT_642482 [Mollisia scopiformis]
MDAEKGIQEKTTPVADLSPGDIDFANNDDLISNKDISSSYWGVLGKWSRKLESLGVEARGIQPVRPDERTPQSYWGLCMIWASAGLTIGTLTAGLLGPNVFNLTFNQTCAIIWGAGALGTSVSAYLAIFGKKNGLRALVNTRFIFGYYGAMIIAALNNLTNIVYGVLDCILGGQTLNTLSKGRLPTIAGMVIMGLVPWFLGTAGFKYIHYYERVAWIGPTIVFISFLAVGASHFETSMAPPTTLDTKTQTGLILSYIAVVYGSFSGWVAISADYYIYFPVKTQSWKIFLMSFLGMYVMPAFAMTCGAGLATALWTDDAWAANWSDNGSVADLLEIVLRPLGPVRYFFIFIFAWSLISNNVFNYYSISITTQIFGSKALMLPRYVYTLISCVIMVIMAIVGRNDLYTVLSDLMAIIGYWCTIYWVIFVEEHLIFRVWMNRGWDLSAWNDRKRLPTGVAAIFAFLVGCMGAILGMSEAWYTGVVGKMIGSEGGDLGSELGFLFAGVAYPVLRWVELKFVDR